MLRVPRAPLQAACAAMLAHLLRRVHLSGGRLHHELHACTLHAHAPCTLHACTLHAHAPCTRSMHTPCTPHNMLHMRMHMRMHMHIQWARREQSCPICREPLAPSPPLLVRPLDALSHKLACKALADDERRDWEVRCMHVCCMHVCSAFCFAPRALCGVSVYKRPTVPTVCTSYLGAPIGLRRAGRGGTAGVGHQAREEARRAAGAGANG